MTAEHSQRPGEDKPQKGKAPNQPLHYVNGFILYGMILYIYGRQIVLGAMVKKRRPTPVRGARAFEKRTSPAGSMDHQSANSGGHARRGAENRMQRAYVTSPPWSTKETSGWFFGPQPTEVFCFENQKATSIAVVVSWPWHDRVRPRRVHPL